MKTGPTSNKPSHEAYALLMVMILAGVSIIVFSSAAKWTSSAIVVTDRNNMYNRTTAAAEAATETILAQMTRDFVINRQRFDCEFTTPFRRGQMGDGLYVMESVGQFDDDAAHVEPHHIEELSDGFYFTIKRQIGAEVRLRELRDSLHQERDASAEMKKDVFFFHGGVLERIVKQRRDDRVLVGLPSCDDFGHRYGVRHVRSAVFAFLLFVRMDREIECALHIREVTRRKVLHFRRKRLKVGYHLKEYMPRPLGNIRTKKGGREGPQVVMRDYLPQPQLPPPNIKMWGNEVENEIIIV